MSHDYRAVQWTPFKKTYDLFLGLGIVGFIAAFVVLSAMTQPAGESFAPIQLLIAATGTLAFSLLTFVLSIGPLARLTDRAKPFLYNRRHLGVVTFLLGLMHGGLVLLWYHGFSETNALVSLLASNPRYDSLQGFPFESLGVIAFFVLFVMAATSHDFWNANLGPGLWKAIHMSVYVAYALLVGHVMLGFIQSQKSLIYTALMSMGSVWLVSIHLLASFKSSPAVGHTDGTWLSVAPVGAFKEGRAQIATPPKGERIAIFLHRGALSAVSNVCRHQGGPLAEGKVIDDCITCPWHGFQYRLRDGRSPEPFTEKIATYNVKVEAGEVYVDPHPNPPGTDVQPVLLGEARTA